MLHPNIPKMNEQCPLALDGWRAYNEQKWNVTSCDLSYKPRGEQGQSLDVIAYKDKQGRFVLPYLNPQWHMRFQSTPTTAPYRIHRQWNEVAELLVKDMLLSKTQGRIALPPEIEDIRKWIWTGFRSFPLYTVMVNFPHGLQDADPKTRGHVKKARKDGFTTELARQPEDLLACINGTEDRKKFSYEFDWESIKLGLELMGPEHFRIYVAYSPEGEPASARLVLFNEGGVAYDILAGTRKKFLSSGATQQLIAHVLEDTQQLGATAFNFSCANIESVSPAKLCWGGELLPMHGIEAFDYIPVRRTLGSVYRLLKNRFRINREQHNSSVPVTK